MENMKSNEICYYFRKKYNYLGIKNPPSLIKIKSNAFDRKRNFCSLINGHHLLRHISINAKEKFAFINFFAPE